MNKEESCNTTLGLGIEVKDKREKQVKPTKMGFWLDLSLPIHPKLEVCDRGDHDHKLYDDGTTDDQDSFSSRTLDDQDQELEQEEETRMKRSNSSNVDYHKNRDGGSRKKLKLTTHQTTALEDSFKSHRTLNTGQKQELAKKLKLLPRQIEVWFQNRRARTKLKQIEQECESLKKYCENLKNENRRLKKELQEARCCPLKLDHRQQQPPRPPLSFYISHPTTTEEDDIGKISKDDCNKKNAIVCRVKN